MIFKTIRFKITVLYMVILAVTLTIFSAILYHNVKTGLYSNMDTLLKSKAGGIAQAIDAYWEASKFEAAESGIKSETMRKRRNADFAKVAQRWVKEESKDPKLIDLLVQVFDTDGAVIASSKNTRDLNEISSKNFISVLQGKTRFDTVSSKSQENEIVLRAYTTPVFENDKVAYIVQVASPLESIGTALSNIRVALIILFPITVLVTGLMGSFLAKAALEPVDSMIQTIHQITAENMELKLKIPDTKDEIQKLAETFNNMLSRLETAFKSQRQLFEDLSHDLKTPLTILKGEFEVSLKKARTQGEYEAILRSALEEVNRISRLAENLLILARLDSKEVMPHKKQLDLDMLLHGIFNNMKVLAHLKDINMFFNCQGKITILADEHQLKTLFFNIIDNAIKYTPQNGQVRINMDNENNSAKVRIEDTGMGIPEEAIGHIFDRFYRVDKSRNSSGFGLGLSISKSIVDAHGGTLSVKSLPGQGTTFIITLPIKS